MDGLYLCNGDTACKVIEKEDGVYLDVGDSIVTRDEEGNDYIDGKPAYLAIKNGDHWIKVIIDEGPFKEPDFWKDS